MVILAFRNADKLTIIWTEMFKPRWRTFSEQEYDFKLFNMMHFFVKTISCKELLKYETKGDLL